jgi:hypothetical protein
VLTVRASALGQVHTRQGPTARVRIREVARIRQVAHMQELARMRAVRRILEAVGKVDGTAVMNPSDQAPLQDRQPPDRRAAPAKHLLK